MAVSEAVWKWSLGRLINHGYKILGPRTEKTIEHGRGYPHRFTMEFITEDDRITSLKLDSVTFMEV